MWTQRTIEVLLLVIPKVCLLLLGNSLCDMYITSSCSSLFARLHLWICAPGRPCTTSRVVFHRAKMVNIVVGRAEFIITPKTKLPGAAKLMDFLLPPQKKSVFCCPWSSWWLTSTHLKNLRKSNWIMKPQDIRGEKFHPLFELPPTEGDFLSLDLSHDASLPCRKSTWRDSSPLIGRKILVGQRWENNQWNHGTCKSLL